MIHGAGARRQPRAPGKAHASCGADRGEGESVAEVRVGKDEPLDRALRRFKRNCRRAGIMTEMRKREHYDKPSVRRKKKAKAAQRQRRRD